MNADYLAKALELVPRDAEILVTSEELGAEIPIEKFQYFPQDKTVWLVLSDDVWEEDEEGDDLVDEVENDTSELSKDYANDSSLRETQPATLSEEIAAVVVIDGSAPDCQIPQTSSIRYARLPLVFDAEYKVLDDEPIKDYGEPAKLEND